MSTSSQPLSNSHNDQRGRAFDFSIPTPLGWVCTPSQSHVGLVFATPGRDDRPSLTFHEHVRTSRRTKQPPPALGERFELAFGLAKLLADLVAVGWVHKGFHSHNLLFFHRIGFRKLFLSGFTYARPEDVENDFSNVPDDETAASLYLLDDATKRKTAKGDIYSLGIVLIELGYWYNMESLLKKENRNKLVEDLGFKCGAVYQSVVRACLACENDEETSDTSDRELMGNILEDLASCRA